MDINYIDRPKNGINFIVADATGKCLLNTDSIPSNYDYSRNIVKFGTNFQTSCTMTFNT